jgi:4-aminobutyrate aminotransferase/(S)-3-amino-2-methylpropionate transaminase
VRPGTTDPSPELARAVSAAAHAEGVIVLSCGTYGNVLRLLPPLSIGDDLLHEALDVLDAAFAATVV